MTDFSSLSIEKVLYLHERIVEAAGGKQGIRDFTLLHSALERCKVTFAGEDLYFTVYDKAGALLHSLVMNHAFLDANKRTGYETMNRFLYDNGLLIQATLDEKVQLCLAVDNEGMVVTQIADWLRNHTQTR